MDTSNGMQNVIPSIRRCDREDYEILVGIWERSVRATHHFLDEDDIASLQWDVSEFDGER